MTFQLVIQFETNRTDDFDELVEFEETLAAELGSIGELDGHDVSPSEFNIFIVTDEPLIAFEKAHQMIRTQKLRYPMRAAYRELTGEEFTILWPASLTQFTVV